MTLTSVKEVNAAVIANTQLTTKIAQWRYSNAGKENCVTVHSIDTDPGLWVPGRYVTVLFGASRCLGAGQVQNSYLLYNIVSEPVGSMRTFL